MDLSYSTLSTILQCGAKLKFKQLGAKGPMGAALVYGSTYHYALRKAMMEDVDPQLSARIGIDSYMSGHVIPGEWEQKNWDGKVLLTAKDAAPDTMKEWIAQAVQLYLKAQPAKPQMMELNLKRDFGTFRLNGFIDAIRNETVLDYKMASPQYKPDPMQAAIYALLLGGPTKFQFHIMRKKSVPQLDIVTIAEAEQQEYLDYMSTMVLPQAAQLMTMDLPANPGSFLCSPKYCQYWQFCMGRVSKAPKEDKDD